jgi:hypothetical protein
MLVVVLAAFLRLVVMPHKLPAVAEVKVLMVLDSMDLPILAVEVEVDQG